MSKRVEFLRRPAKYIVVVEYNGKMPSLEDQNRIIEAFVSLCTDGIVNYPTVTVLNKDDITKIIAKHVANDNGQDGQPAMVVSPEERPQRLLAMSLRTNSRLAMLR